MCSVASVMSDSVTLWTVALQAPLSMGFPRQEYWSGLPIPSPGDLPNPGIEPRIPALQENSLPTIRDSKLSLPINKFVLTFIVGMVIYELIKNDPHSL